MYYGNPFNGQHYPKRGIIGRNPINLQFLLTSLSSSVNIHKLSQKTRQKKQKESKENQGFSRGEPENFLQN